MHRCSIARHSVVLLGICFLWHPLFSSGAQASEPLTERAWKKGEHGAVVVQANWGRQWNCAGFENAQLVSLAFAQRSQDADGAPDRIELETPSLLRVDDRFLPYVFLVRPGTYELSAFEIKAAKSVSEVFRREVDAAELTRNGEADGGSFRVEAGEIVYIGGFGLDCAHEPIPWRYYIDSAAKFDEAVAGFRNKFPFVRDVPVRYRLFSSTRFAEPPVFPEGQAPPIEESAPPPAPDQ